MATPTVLITGNEGYIGSVVTTHFCHLGYRVLGLDSGIFKNAAFIPRSSFPYDQIYKDVRDIQFEDLQGVESVIHLAALSNDPVGQLDERLTEDINYQATVRLASLARRAGVQRFLFSSSCSIYGAAGESLVDEQASFAPQTAYARSKVQAETAISGLATEHFSPIFLRNATAFGSSARMRLDLVVQNLLALGWINRNIHLLSDGTPWRPLVHVQDIAEAFAFLIAAPRAAIHNQAFNIGHPENNVQIATVAALIQQTLPEASITISPQASPDTRSYRVSFKKINQLGWQARYKVIDGIQEMLDVFTSLSLDQALFNTPIYHTVQYYQWCVDHHLLDASFRPVGMKISTT